MMFIMKSIYWKMMILILCVCLYILRTDFVTEIDSVWMYGTIYFFSTHFVHSIVVPQVYHHLMCDLAYFYLGIVFILPVQSLCFSAFVRAWFVMQ